MLIQKIHKAQKSKNQWDYHPPTWTLPGVVNVEAK